MLGMSGYQSTTQNEIIDIESTQLRTSTLSMFSSNCEWSSDSLVSKLSIQSIAIPTAYVQKSNNLSINILLYNSICKCFHKISYVQKKPESAAFSLIFKMFKSKGAVFVLIWSFCGFSVFHSLFDTHFSHNNIQWQIGKVTITRFQMVPPCFMLYSLFGWIADMKFGRYKVIKWRFIMLMVLSVIFCIISVFQKKIQFKCDKQNPALLACTYDPSLGWYSCQCSPIGHRSTA